MYTAITANMYKYEHTKYWAAYAPLRGRIVNGALRSTASRGDGAFSSCLIQVQRVFYIQMVPGTKDVEWRRLGQQATGEEREMAMRARQGWDTATRST